jgi:hypothetical protein
MAEGMKYKPAEQIAAKHALAGYFQQVASSMSLPNMIPSELVLNVPSEHSDVFPLETYFVSQQAAVIEAKSAIAAGENAVQVAYRLSMIVKGGVRQCDLVGALGKSKSWISKRIGLLRAPVAVRRLIEAGKLSECDYYDNRRNVLAGIKKAKEGFEYQRVQTVCINLEAARLLALMLRDLAERNRAAPIRVSVEVNRRQIESILNTRPLELLKGLKL